MKKIDGNELTLGDLIQIINNPNIAINIDIAQLNDKKQYVPIASVSFNDDIGRKEIMKLLVLKDGGYTSTMNLANYLKEIGRYLAKVHDRPELEESHNKAADLIVDNADIMLNKPEDTHKNTSTYSKKEIDKKYYTTIKIGGKSNTTKYLSEEEFRNGETGIVFINAENSMLECHPEYNEDIENTSENLEK